MRSLLRVLSLMALLCACSDDRAKLHPSVPLSADQALRGRELVTGLGACGYCHGAAPDPSAPLSGGRASYDLFGEVRASNLTPSRSGLGEWQVKDVMRAIRSRQDLEGNKLSPEAHKGMEWMADKDLLAMVAYLRTLPPVENRVERRSLSFVTRNTTGFFESGIDLRGYVPGVDPRNQTAYGKYLVANVARCTSCHNTAGTLLTSEGHLSGGKIIKTERGEKVAPDITGSLVYGIGHWSEDAIVHYLRSGETPDHKRVDPAYCPVNFYANASETDLRAVAAYLKSLGGGK